MFKQMSTQEAPSCNVMQLAGTSSYKFRTMTMGINRRVGRESKRRDTERPAEYSASMVDNTYHTGTALS